MNRIEVNGLPIYNKINIKAIGTIISKMLNTLENPYLKRGPKPVVPKYPDDLIGGIEIETCITEDFKPELTFYYEVGDLTISCGKGFKATEFIADPVPLKELLDETTPIGKETTYLLQNAHKCEWETCSTHVHISMKSVTVHKYPHFETLMRYLWIQYYQPYCMFKFYQHETRYDSEYAHPSTHVPREEYEPIEPRYEMFNTVPSYETETGFLSPNRAWHFEFRGYGSMLGKLNKEYIHILMNLWVITIRYYNYLLAQTRYNKIHLKNMTITRTELNTFDITKLLLMVKLRECIDRKWKPKGSTMEDLCKAIIEFDKTHKLGDYNEKEKEYYRLHMVYYPYNFKL